MFSVFENMDNHPNSMNNYEEPFLTPLGENINSLLDCEETINNKLLPQIFIEIKKSINKERRIMTFLMVIIVHSLKILVMIIILRKETLFSNIIIAFLK